MNYYDNILKAYASTLSSGGSSLHNTLMTKPKNGFMVSVQGHEHIIPYVSTMGEFISAWTGMQKIAESIQLRETIPTYVGTWVHEGQIVFDVSYNFTSLDVAEAMGKQHKQKAIYDVANDKEIFLS